VPYQFAWRYQKVNADYLVEQGTAVRLEAGALDGELLPTLTCLLDDDARLSAMRDRMRALAREDAAAQLASELAGLAERTR
jgi:UDP-N-acetylglucosamine--N-acetylmuramyl-(pentapeptide) pyrophosphoryl-undecaprenol N-acetylglucosamine transferase